MVSQELLARLADAKSVVAFTGAGISAESGIPTFRDHDGLWARFNSADLANPEAFERDPQTVWSWYQSRRAALLNARPNAAHLALAQLQSHVPSVSVITQNVDGLHALAGSRNVIELHGNILQNYCHRCHQPFNDPDLLHAPAVPACACGGLIRPNIVLFGEMLPEDAFAQAEQLSAEADVFLSIGTSGQVYPAARLPTIPKGACAYTVEINPEITPLSCIMDEVYREPAGAVLPRILQTLLRDRAPLAAPVR